MSLHWIVSSMGYKPFMWPAPTGHPDKDTYWMGPGAMIRRWKTSETIFLWKDFGVFNFNFSANTPVNISYEAIIDYWSERIIFQKLPDQYRKEVINLITGEKTPETVPDLSDGKMENTLLMFVQFLTSTPYFQTR